MPATVSFQPYTTTTSTLSFQLQTDGFIQGFFQDSPVSRYFLEGGVVSANQLTPIWGGLPLSLTIPGPGLLGSSSGTGAVATVAASTTTIDAWCVLNQAAAGVITSNSTSPLFPSGASLNFGRIGCGMLMALPVNPTAVNTLALAASNTPLYWNATLNAIDIVGAGAFSTALTGPSGAALQFYAVNTNSKTIAYNATTGFCTWVPGGSVIIVRI
jgi:hypothetical protein